MCFEVCFSCCITQSKYRHYTRISFDSLFKDRVPHRDRQQAVDVVGDRAALHEQEHSDNRCHTQGQFLQGVAGILHEHVHKYVIRNAA